MFDSIPGEAAAERQDAEHWHAGMRGMRGGGGNGNHGNGESHPMRGSATKHAQSGNIPLPFLAAFATHNTKRQVAHPGKPA